MDMVVGIDTEMAMIDLTGTTAAAVVGTRVTTDTGMTTGHHQENTGTVAVIDAAGSIFWSCIIVFAVLAGDDGIVFLA